MTSIFRQTLLMAAAFLPLSAAGAQGMAFENLDALEQRLIGALDADIGFPGGPATPIDRRLRLQRCPVAAQLDPPALGAVAIRCPQAGWRIRVPLVRANTPALQTRAEPVIRKGDPVTLSVQTGSFSVTTESVAQEDGAIGDRIRIKADPKAPVMIAEVVNGGQVRLPGYR